MRIVFNKSLGYSCQHIYYVGGTTAEEREKVTDKRAIGAEEFSRKDIE